MEAEITKSWKHRDTQQPETQIGYGHVLDMDMYWIWTQIGQMDWVGYGYGLDMDGYGLEWMGGSDMTTYWMTVPFCPEISTILIDFIKEQSLEQPDMTSAVRVEPVMVFKSSEKHSPSPSKLHANFNP
ncbi:hypothetical protein BDR07DRAFT_1482704 [Suillus spraguei]|nr:hypothetical protein BDR07DRAFT_1482704 [Suillus spraguei]